MGDRQIAVIAASFAFSFPAKMLAHIRNSIKPGETLVQYATGGESEALEKKRFDSVLQQTGPVVLIGICVQPDAATIAAYRVAKIPIVLIDEIADGASTITTNNVAGGYLATEHLIRNGRKNIAVVSGRTNVRGGYNAVQRLSGARKAMNSNGLTLTDDFVIEVKDYSYNDGVAAINALRQAGRKVDGVFAAAGDDCAAGILRAARDNGLNVPNDLAVVGYDDTEIARILTPTLTTIRQPLQEMAEAAYKIATTENLTDLLSNPRSVSFEPELVPRESA
jgi:LacI family transcriptional regulator